MTANEMALYIGKVAQHDAAGYSATVRIYDARMSYGRIQLRVTPVTGNGNVWVNADSLTSVREAS